ncbi:MAG: glycoside hydrolase family 3 N-terminal domain-containing protein [Bacilli bacterium]
MKRNKRIIIGAVSVIILILIYGISLIVSSEGDNELIQSIEGTVLAINDDLLTIEDDNDTVYTFSAENVDVGVGEEIKLDYKGILDKEKDIQDAIIINYTVYSVLNEDDIPLSYMDNGIFSDYYKLAYNKLKTLSLDEKIGQLLLVRYPESNQVEDLKKYKFAGYVFFERDFRDKTKSGVLNMIDNVQNVSNIPLLTAVDEEGGSVVRVSSNPNLASSSFKSSKELYASGGMNAISEDTKEKSKLLKSLGLNLNLAPVVDVSTNPSDYMYRRTIGENTSVTSEYAKTVIEASKGTLVSYTLKHFPGYSNNVDTHTGSSTDTRSLSDIRTNDLPPFETGINAGAEAVLVSHNIVTSIDSSNPASLSSGVHDLLRNDLNFTGVIITDDLSMGATSSITDAAVKAVKAGNDLIITTDYEESFNSIKSSVNSGTLSENDIDRHVFRILAWKYYKGLMFENQK